MSSVRSQAIVGAVLLMGGVMGIAGCIDSAAPTVRVVGGDPRAGRLLTEQFACGSCHEIPDTRRALGIVGPPLHTFARHVYIAGELPNVPEQLVAFLQDPPALVPGTAMPDLGLTEQQARDIAAFLYEVR